MGFPGDGSMAEFEESLQHSYLFIKLLGG